MTQSLKSKIISYQPLIVIILLAVLASVALGLSGQGFSAMRFMNHFMGIFFLIFAMLKLFDISAFAKGFSMYDLIAKRFAAYGFIYPFIELGLGLLYLSGRYSDFTNLATIVVMSVGAVGVVSSIRNGLKVNCACLGTVLNVPLSTVSILENVGMGLMAAVMYLVY